MIYFVFIFFLFLILELNNVVIDVLVFGLLWFECSVIFILFFIEL